MDMIIVMLSAYVLIAIVCMTATYSEGSLRKLPWDRRRVMGLFLSFLWPLLPLILIVTLFFERCSGRGRSGQQGKSDLRRG